jgi:hypothetical protein
MASADHLHALLMRVDSVPTTLRHELNQAVHHTISFESNGWLCVEPLRKAVQSLLQGCTPFDELYTMYQYIELLNRTFEVDLSTYALMLQREWEEEIDGEFLQKMSDDEKVEWYE